jgi:hypothetical protein
MQLTISGQIGSLDAKSSLKVQNHIAFDKQKTKQVKEMSAQQAGPAQSGFLHSCGCHSRNTECIVVCGSLGAFQ